MLAVLKIGSDIARSDWSQLFLFTVLISLDLAIVNLLPVPPLDGSYIALFALEGLRGGKPINERAQDEMRKWGVVGLLLLMLLVTFNDITAWMGGKLELKQHKDNQSESKSNQPEKPAEHTKLNNAAQ